MKRFTPAAMFVLGVSPAFAQYYEGPMYRYDPDVTGSIAPAPGGYRPYATPYRAQERFGTNSAAESNANALTQPQPNFGGVSGGYMDAE